MPLFDRIKFDASSDELLVWKHPSEGIILGSQLIVNQSQEACFVRGGKILDVFGPGTHTLSTDNLPILNHLINAPFGSKTPFAAEIWYINKTVKRDLKWGTPRPIPILDPMFNFLINVRAFGRWGIRIDNTRSFMFSIIGTLPNATHEMVVQYFIGEIVQKFSVVLSHLFTEQKVSIVEASSHLNELSTAMSEELKAEFCRFGIDIINFNIESITFAADEVKKIQDVLAKKMEMEQLGKMQVGQGYITAKTFDTLEKAAQNSGAAGGIMAGGLGLGLGLSAGADIGKQLAKSLHTGDQNSNIRQDMASNAANEIDDPMIKLTKIKQMLDARLITQEEFEAKKRQILESL